MEQMIAVALSGGVDSTVAAILLRQKNSRMVGATHYIWPDSRCCSIPVFKRAEYLARLLTIPYYVIDLQQDFRQKVVDDFVATYAAGMTPNPCVRCNEHIRFTRFYFLLKEKLEAEGLLARDERLCFATGHYARFQETPEGLFLKKARDPRKDQTYMLSRVPKEMLPFLVFPLGEYLKTEVVEIARQNNFSIQETPESQDACFIEDDYAKFVIQESSQAVGRPGDIVDMQGKVRGSHQGYIHYTVGQRKGLGLGDGPWYVAGIRPEANEVVVGREDEMGEIIFRVGALNWFIMPPEEPLECMVKIRYQSRDIPARVSPLPGNMVEVELPEKGLITPGQSAVFYRDDLVIGSGIIARN